MAYRLSFLLVIGLSLFSTVWKGAAFAGDVGVLMLTSERDPEDSTPPTQNPEPLTWNIRADREKDLRPIVQLNLSNHLSETEPERRSKKGHGFPSDAVTLDASGGNRFLSMHRLDLTFSNQVRQPLSFRGGALMMSGKWWNGTIFGGHLADPSKTFPSEAILYDELVSGIALKVYPFTQKIAFGTTAIQLSQDGPSSFTPFQNGRLVLSEIDLNVAGGLHFLAEYGILESDQVLRRQEPDGSFLRAGPLYRDGEFYFEAQYRRIAPTFFLPVWAFENDQEGLFTAFSLTPPSPISFNGSGEVFKNNINDDPALSTWQTVQWQVGMKWAFSTLPVLSISYGERDHALVKATAPEDRAAKFYQVELSKALWGVDTHASYHKETEEDPLLAERMRDRGGLSLFFPLYIGSSMWIRGEGYRNQSSEIPFIENGFLVSAGARLSLPFKGVLWSELPIVKSNPEPLAKPGQDIGSGIGIRFPLPWRADIDASYRLQRNPFRSRIIQARITQQIDWGILGRP
jgi:hypothetical protein